ncbi:unnamed protein product [Owenia fusiformis]|uniref:Uncharacterized protein n=1 Tax=Owenia fusiformis TaxID=6347 RepID=A0A8S4P5H5_OWEFU|nr:unnamed protein product [Owenia fusiformis]
MPQSSLCSQVQVQSPIVQSSKLTLMLLVNQSPSQLLGDLAEYQSHLIGSLKSSETACILKVNKLYDRLCILPPPHYKRKSLDIEVHTQPAGATRVYIHVVYFIVLTLLCSIQGLMRLEYRHFI